MSNSALYRNREMCFQDLFLKRGVEIQQLTYQMGKVCRLMHQEDCSPSGITRGNIPLSEYGMTDCCCWCVLVAFCSVVNILPLSHTHKYTHTHTHPTRLLYNNCIRAKKMQQAADDTESWFRAPAPTTSLSLQTACSVDVCVSVCTLATKTRSLPILALCCCCLWRLTSAKPVHMYTCGKTRNQFRNHCQPAW